eukprot:COSAG02_NODE_45393_length_357_cov_1.201550_1_plen_57_part_00
MVEDPGTITIRGHSDRAEYHIFTPGLMAPTLTGLCCSDFKKIELKHRVALDTLLFE